MAGRRVLVRADLNVPLDGGRVADDTRIRAALPTIELLLGSGAAVVLTSHLGRPKGVDPELSLAPVAARLGELLDAEVELAPALVGHAVRERAEATEAGSVLLLENSRFEAGEKANDPDLARALADLADLYVNDAFGAAHRAHATTEGVAHLLPAYAGLLLERELDELTAVRDNPAPPLVVILGGAKVTDKIGVLERFLEIADSILIGGAMCFSFFRAKGIATGDSLVEEEGVGLARDVLAAAAPGPTTDTPAGKTPTSPSPASPPPGPPTAAPPVSSTASPIPPRRTTRWSGASSSPPARPMRRRARPRTAPWRRRSTTPCGADFSWKTAAL